MEMAFSSRWTSQPRNPKKFYLKNNNWPKQNKIKEKN